MVAAAADVQITATTAATSTTAAATATTTTQTLASANSSSSVEFAALTAASASGSQAATSNLNNNNSRISNHTDNTDSSSNSSNNNNMDASIVAVDAAKTTATTSTPTAVEGVSFGGGDVAFVAPEPSKSAVSQRHVDIRIEKTSNMEHATKQLAKKVLKLELGGKNIDEYSLKSPKSPISARLPHQTSLTSSVDVEDRKTLREALYQGIFHRHRRTIFAVGSFLRMLRSRNSQYNTIRSSSEGEDIDEVR